MRVELLFFNFTERLLSLLQKKIKYLLPTFSIGHRRKPFSEFSLEFADQSNISALENQTVNLRL